MNFYHMSQTLQLGNQLIVDYQKNIELVQPFVQALEQGRECEEEQQKVHLFEVELNDTVPQRRDMNIYDEAYEAMTKNQDVEFVFTCTRRYFAGEHTQEPVWEILSDKNAKTVADISYILR